MTAFDLLGCIYGKMCVEYRIPALPLRQPGIEMEGEAMAEQTKGKCKYCGKEYTKAYMTRHLDSCKERKAVLEAEAGSMRYGYFELVIYGKYDKNYWMVIEIRDDTTLKVLDGFLRDIWLECCGHLSAFEIEGVSYETAPDEDNFWGRPVKDMKYKLKSVLRKGMKVNYEYDFGSTTELIIEVRGHRTGGWRKEKLTILSRNNAPEYLCDKCHKKKAVMLCPQHVYNGEEVFLCEACGAKLGDEEYIWAVCNSPRMGVCGYEGIEIYPEQFVPDTEKE